MLEAGDRVIRSNKIRSFWTVNCRNSNKDPKAVYTVHEVDGMCIRLEGFLRHDLTHVGFDKRYFRKVK